MADLWDELTARPETPAAAAPDLWNQLTKPTEELRAPRQPVKWGQTTPTDTTEAAAPAFRALGAGMLPDEKDQIRFYAQRRFPDLPEDEAISRYGVLNGNIVYMDEKGGISREVPSVFGGGAGEVWNRGRRWLASQMGPAIPGVAGSIAGVLSGPTPASIPIAGAIAGGADVVRQAIGKTMIGESPLSVDPLNALGQGGMAGAGQTVGVAARGMMERNPLRISSYDRKVASDPAFQAEVAAIQAEAKARGIDLSAAQATQLRSLKVRERRLGRDDVTADMMSEFVKKQRDMQVPAALRGEIAAIAPIGGREAQINAFREGADTVATKALDARNAIAKPAYERALDTATPYIDDKLVGLLKRPSMAEAWGAAKRIAAEEDRQLPEFFDIAADGSIKYTGKAVPDWRSWDYIKRGLDSVIDAHTNEFGKVDNIGRVVANTKRDLLATLDAVNPEYKAARGLYGTASDAIDAIVNGKAGDIAKLDGQAAQNMVTRAFGARSILPEQMTRMRQQFYMAGKKDEFNSGLAAFLSDKLDEAMKVNASGERGNVAGKFQSVVWGDEAQRKVITAALGDPAKADSFGRFMEVLRRAGSSLAEGSPTATDMGANITDTTGLVRRGMTALTNPFKIGEMAAEGLSALRDPAKKRALAEALIGGDYDKELTKLRLVNPRGPQAAAIVAAILERWMTPKPDDFAAPAMQPRRQ